MNNEFCESVYYGHIIKGDLHGAMDYVRCFLEKAELYGRYKSVFEDEHYITYEEDPKLNEILVAYQKYFRDVFYLCIDKAQAAEKLKVKLCEALDGTGVGIELADLEQKEIPTVFRINGWYFLGGQTGGYYGPYIWKTTETVSYRVELPDGVQNYTVKLLDGFIFQSWIDYLSFGKIGTGGWSDESGVINCVKSSYDFESESFKVSLLKHEAQHARDLKANKNMSPNVLEYRAKLVELIYSYERNLLEQFAQEADRTDKSNGHAIASAKIIDGFIDNTGLSCEEILKLPISKVQSIAKGLFEDSGELKVCGCC